MLDGSTFQYLAPTPSQLDDMKHAQFAAEQYAEALANFLPDGPDKTYALRKLREVAMWANIAITRQPDGSPRT